MVSLRYDCCRCEKPPTQHAAAPAPPTDSSQFSDDVEPFSTRELTSEVYVFVIKVATAFGVFVLSIGIGERVEMVVCYV